MYGGSGSSGPFRGSFFKNVKYIKSRGILSDIIKDDTGSDNNLNKMYYNTFLRC